MAHLADKNKLLRKMATFYRLWLHIKPNQYSKFVTKMPLVQCISGHLRPYQMHKKMFQQNGSDTLKKTHSDLEVKMKEEKCQ